MLGKALKFLTSLKLTAVCLALAIVLVFIGTLAQVDEGLYQAQARYFKSFLIHRPLNLPVVYPGGYLIGIVLMLNLLAAHAIRFKPTRKKIGLFMIHAGVVLLLFGQLLTELLSRESSMRLVEGQTKNYSESFRENELALVDVSNPQNDSVICLPETMLAKQREFSVPQTPFTLRVKHYWPNSILSTKPGPVAVKADATSGICSEAQVYVFPVPASAKSNERDMPSSVIEVLVAGSAGVSPASIPLKSLGSWLVSPHINEPQHFTWQGASYNLALRFTRHYLFTGSAEPFKIHLLKFDHDVYRGTEALESGGIPKNFSSRVRVQNPATGEDREVVIKMNSPLRYKGETFYQASFDETDPRARATVLEVVHNPSWLTPYLSCLLVGFGLLVQFCSHLAGFVRKGSMA